jgi:hypothetical protein
MHHHMAFVNYLARPEGYEAIGLPGPPHTIEHSTVHDWLSSMRIVHVGAMPPTSGMAV